jgi:hypothetical protein
MKGNFLWKVGVLWQQEYNILGQGRASVLQMKFENCSAAKKYG